VALEAAIGQGGGGNHDDELSKGALAHFAKALLPSFGGPEFLFDGGHARLQLAEFFLSVSPHLGIFFFRQHGLALGDAARQILVFPIFLHDARDFAVRLGGLLVFRRIVDDIRRCKSAGQLFVAGFDLV